jgi:hypothetical protein
MLDTEKRPIYFFDFDHAFKRLGRFHAIDHFNATCCQCKGRGWIELVNKEHILEECLRCSGTGLHPMPLTEFK